MRQEQEPPGGLTLNDAFNAYTDPETLQAAQEATRRAQGVRDTVTRYDSSNRLVVDINNPAVRQADSCAENARRAAIRDFWEKFVSRELVAWGAEGSPTASRRVVPKEAWLYLRPANWRTSVLKGPDRLRIFAVQVYEAAEPETCRPGRPSRRNEIKAAYQRLSRCEEVSFDNPQIQTIRMIREEVMRDAGNDDSTGLGDEVIRKYIAADFQAEKRKRLKAP